MSTRVGVECGECGLCRAEQLTHALTLLNDSNVAGGAQAEWRHIWQYTGQRESRPARHGPPPLGVDVRWQDKTSTVIIIDKVSSNKGSRP